MIHHRTWSDWFRMHWVIGVTVKMTDSQVNQYVVESTRWWILACIHMLVVEYRFKSKYPSAQQVITWLDWKV